MQLRLPDISTVYGEEKKVLFSSALSQETSDIVLSSEMSQNTLSLSLKGDSEPLCHVVVKWFFREEERREHIRILGDDWERAYGNMEWRGVNPDRKMPWYFLVADGSDALQDNKGRFIEGFGVKVRPSALCSWQYDRSGIALCMDIRSGAKGVILKDRTLPLCEVLFEEWRDLSAYECGKRFCAKMCDDPKFPKIPVFGFNNWYYAYGNSSAEQILEDARFLASCTTEIKHRPFMVIDSGWEKNPVDGPWDEGNKRFPDMKALAEGMLELGVLPGLWIRPLSQKATYALPSSWRSMQNQAHLDPSHPEVLSYVRECISRIANWGYRLIKYDFVTFDMFEHWGFEEGTFLPQGDFTFYDRTKTTAEIMCTLYKTIKEAAGDAILIACNAMSHLCAGLVEINRTGDDTSGKEWARTRKMGVNTLAFRSIQNHTFYIADADCVGITEDIPWELNERWLQILSHSDAPLFVSWDRKVDAPRVHKAVVEGLYRNVMTESEIVPIDWMENTIPAVWSLNGERLVFDWFSDILDAPKP